MTEAKLEKIILESILAAPGHVSGEDWSDPADPKDKTPHTIIELPDGSHLHRYTNGYDYELSSIYLNGVEVAWHYRSEEERMVKWWLSYRARKGKYND